MKKRKIKLFASVASLAMVAAVMGVGVWAASTQAVNVSSTVQFNATGIAAQVAFQASGNGLKAATLPSELTYVGAQDDATSADAKANKVILGEFGVADTTTAITNSLHIQLQDADGDGFVNAAETVVYTFTITPDAAGVGIAYNVVVTNGNTSFDITATTCEAASTDAFDITVTFAPKEISQTIDGEGNKNVKLADIAISLFADADQIADASIAYQS